ncbi:MAG: hypothetical protein IPH53_09375 [Flavobacteriales bacterium]|nr:hypothetical protein [Flavobacteriales bacterium]
MMRTLGLLMACSLALLNVFAQPGGIVRTHADSLPPLNKGVLTFVRSQVNKRVGRGECWDLAAAALDVVKARWDGAYFFGRPVDPRTEVILPGDIVQFEGVEVLYEEEGITTRQRMPHHTAVIYEAHGEGRYTLAHQNFGPAGRKVGLSEWSTAHVVKGKYTFFRPAP